MPLSDLVEQFLYPQTPTIGAVLRDHIDNLKLQFSMRAKSLTTPTDYQNYLTRNQLYVDFKDATGLDLYKLEDQYGRQIVDKVMEIFKDEYRRAH